MLTFPAAVLQARIMVIQWVALPHAQPDTKTTSIGNSLTCPFTGLLLHSSSLLTTYLPGTKERGLCFFLDVTEML